MFDLREYISEIEDPEVSSLRVLFDSRNNQAKLVISRWTPNTEIGKESYQEMALSYTEWKNSVADMLKIVKEDVARGFRPRLRQYLSDYRDTHLRAITVAPNEDRTEVSLIIEKWIPASELGSAESLSMRVPYVQWVDWLESMNQLVQKATPKDPNAGRRGHKLMTKKLEKEFPEWMSTDGQGGDALVIAKYFHPLSQWYWYAIEYHAEDRLFFGWVKGDFPELGYFSLDELENISVKGLPIERDLYWKPMTLREVKKLHKE